ANGPPPQCDVEAATRWHGSLRGGSAGRELLPRLIGASLVVDLADILLEQPVAVPHEQLVLLLAPLRLGCERGDLDPGDALRLVGLLGQPDAGTGRTLGVLLHRGGAVVLVDGSPPLAPPGDATPPGAASARAGSPTPSGIEADWLHGQAV